MPTLIDHLLQARMRLALLGVLAVGTLALLAVPAQSKANSVNFCYNVTLQPYGHNGDRCFGPGSYIFGINLVTFERAGCVTVADGSNNLLQSWTCGGAGSWPGAAVTLNFANDGKWRKPVIRNNNLSFTGVFQGGLTCYSGC